MLTIQDLFLAYESELTPGTDKLPTPLSLYSFINRSTQAQERNLKDLLHQKGATGVTNARDRYMLYAKKILLLLRSFFFAFRFFCCTHTWHKKEERDEGRLRVSTSDSHQWRTIVKLVPFIVLTNRFFLTLCFLFPTRLREEYERLILTDIVLAQSKEIESALWKNVFYIVIDGYRRKLTMLGRPDNGNDQSNQQHQKQQQGRRGGGGGRGDEGGRGGSRDGGRSRPHGSRGNKPPVPSVEFRKVSTKFRAFIQEATGFYHRLIQNLASCYDLNESGDSMHAVPIGGMEQQDYFLSVSATKLSSIEATREECGY